MDYSKALQDVLGSRGSLKTMSLQIGKLEICR